MKILSTATAATKAVAAKTAKPRVALDLGTVILAILTGLSVAPYTMGDIATIIPPDWKPWLFLISLIANGALQALRPYMKSPHAPEENPGENPET